MLNELNNYFFLFYYIRIMDKILNPTTGRLVKTTSILGKKIINGYIPPDKIKQENKASKDIQKVSKGYLATKQNSLPFKDAINFPEAFTIAQADVILNQQIKDNDILLAVKDTNKMIKETNKPKIKKTNKRSLNEIK